MSVSQAETPHLSHVPITNRKKTSVRNPTDEKEAERARVKERENDDHRGYAEPREQSVVMKTETWKAAPVVAAQNSPKKPQAHSRRESAEVAAQTADTACRTGPRTAWQRSSSSEQPRPADERERGAKVAEDRRADPGLAAHCSTTGIAENDPDNKNPAASPRPDEQKILGANNGASGRSGGRRARSPKCRPLR